MSKFKIKECEQKKNNVGYSTNSCLSGRNRGCAEIDKVNTHHYKKQVLYISDNKTLSMKSLTFITMLIIFLLVRCENSFAQIDSTQREHSPNGHNSPYRIAFGDLISNPRYYEGEQLAVTGYLNLAFETDALWLSEADYKALNHNKAIPVTLDKVNLRRARRFNHKYVIIEAVFRSWDRGLGLTTFDLNVKSLKRWRENGVNK
jgi:hypothetical protein